MDVVKLTSQLIRFPSVSGVEQDVINFVEKFALQNNFAVRRIAVDPVRDNLLISVGDPKALLSTHLDVVPGSETLFNPEIRGDKLYGRGSCDAKGLAAAMLCAALELRDAGYKDFGVLLVVGEESGGDGARAASKALQNSHIRWIINGEPTQGCLMQGHKGALYCELIATGKACHSGYPELGESAIDKLLAVLARIKNTDFGSHPVLGSATVNIGQISGGSASNVIAAHASATLLIRTVTNHKDVEKSLRAAVRDELNIKDLDIVDPVTLEVRDGYKCAVASYCSDIPNLLSTGAKFLLYGPGTIQVAHTDYEHIDIKELHKSVKDYADLLKSCLN